MIQHTSRPSLVAALGRRRLVDVLSSSIARLETDYENKSLVSIKQHLHSACSLGMIHVTC